MTNEQAITELIAATKLTTKALEEMHSYMSIIDKRVTSLEAKQENAPTYDVKNELLAEIVNNSTICRNCDIYRDAWNMCFMASECLTNNFKFFKQRKEVEE